MTAGPPHGAPPGFTRRSFLKGASAAAVVGAVPIDAQAKAPATSPHYPPGLHEVTLRVNGEDRTTKVEPRTTLLDALRDRLDLTGAKKICDRGACGGCTVLVDGVAVNSCMMLALDAVGAEVLTVEGLSPEGQLHPLQQEFVRCDALQCGFCTPGMVMAAYACLQRTPNPTLAQVQHDMSGNICRCGTYNRVFEAVQRTAAAAGAAAGVVPADAGKGEPKRSEGGNQEGRR